MRHLRNKILLFVVAMAFYPLSSIASCNITISGDPILITLDSFFVAQLVNFTVAKNGEEACNVRLGFSGGIIQNYDRKATNLTTETINYNLYENNSPSYPLKDGEDVVSINETIEISFDTGSQTKFSSFYVFVNQSELLQASNFKSSGVYSDTFRISAYLSENFPNSLLGYTNLSLAIEIPEKIEILIADVGEDFAFGDLSRTLDFGVLDYQKTLQIDVIVKANIGYKIAASSQNEEKLRHLIFDKGINYNFRINGRLEALGSLNSVIETKTSPSSTSGDRNRLAITTDAIDSSKPAGDYEDVILLSVEAL